jgi:hypothetical protein
MVGDAFSPPGFGALPAKQTKIVALFYIRRSIDSGKRTHGDAESAVSARDAENIAADRALDC